MSAMTAIAIAVLSLACILSWITNNGLRRELREARVDLARTQGLLKESMDLTNRNQETIKIYEGIMEGRK